MTKYETVYILDPSFDENAANEEADRVSGWMKDLGGEVVEVQKWGKRRLAYLVKDFTEGYYCIFRFTGTPATVAELNRVMKITDDILRHMIVKEDE